MSFTGSLPREFGPYLLLEPLGHGATATVFRATDRRSSQTVAVKIITRATELQVKRFQRELKALSRLRHRHIVAFRDGGILEGRPFLVMDFVAGARPLDELSRRDDLLPLSDALRVLREASRAIEYAHQTGVLHRDLKPANILVDPTGRARVLDFGLASLLEGGGERLTRTGFLVGTPAYMAPEQAAGEPCAQSDVYALGATLYHVVTGLHPFEDLGINPLTAGNKRPTSASGLRQDLPPGINALIERCLAPAVEDRFPSAGAVAKAIDDQLEALRRGGVEAPSRAPLLVALTLATVGLLGVGVWALTPPPLPASSGRQSPAPTAPLKPTTIVTPEEQAQARFAGAIARLREAVTAFALPQDEAVRRATDAARELASRADHRTQLEAVGADLANELERRALAWTARALKFDARVVAALDRAADLARHDPQLLTRLRLTKVDVLLRRGLYVEAERAARSVPGDRQAQLRARYYRASAISNQPRRETEAARAFQTIAEEDPQGVVGMTALAKILSKTWKYDESNRVLLKVIELDPAWRPARRILALGLSFRSQGSKAREVLAPALRQAPDDFRIHAMLGFAWMHENFDRSLAAFDTSIRLGGERAGAIKWRGIIALRAKYLKRARRDLARALELKPSADTLIWHGLVRWRQGERDQAAREWRGAYQKNPTAFRRRMGDMPRDLRERIWRIGSSAPKAQ